MSQYQQYSRPVPSTGFIDTVSNRSTFGEIILAVVIVLVVFILFFTSESIYNGMQTITSRYQTLMDYTASSQDKALVIHQDKTKYPDAKPILLSENEPTGTEFAYSFFLYVNSNTFSSGNDVLYHVWHKGYGCVWPLMGPGVFVRGISNTLRIFMNTYENPYTYVDIPNIPVKKWFHVVLNCHKGGLEVHINGNLANKIRFDKTLPYLNFQDIILFSNANFVLNPKPSAITNAATPTVGVNNMEVSGTFNGFMSEFIYARYAFSFTEIQSLMHAGISKKLKTENMELPPYLADTWWAKNYSS